MLSVWPGVAMIWIEGVRVRAERLRVRGGEFSCTGSGLHSSLQLLLHHACETWWPPDVQRRC